MTIQMTVEKGPVPVHVWTRNIQSAAVDQLVNISKLDIIGPHVAGMPDVHAGIGATVGSVIPTRQAIIPAAVGVDIGCGMIAVATSLFGKDLPDSLADIRSAIEARVPVGFDKHNTRTLRRDAAKGLQQGLEVILDKHPSIVERSKNHDAWAHQIGTLGGGNHFIELCLDETERVWIMLHSGSRGIGNLIGRYFIERAKEEMLALDDTLPDRDLAYLREGTASFDDYWEALLWAQGYAAENRAQMLILVLEALREQLPAFDLVDQAINCHHNYVQLETHYGEPLYVTRKGAIRAGAGELGIIPGSMGAKSYIVRGKGNEQSYCSCSHGAGRQMSRGEAKRRFTVEDLKHQTEGVTCRKDAGVIDEAPGAYKDIDQVMADQTDLVSIEHTLKQIVCVKG